MNFGKTPPGFHFCWIKKCALFSFVFRNFMFYKLLGVDSVFCVFSQFFSFHFAVQFATCSKSLEKKQDEKIENDHLDGGIKILYGQSGFWRFKLGTFPDGLPLIILSGHG